MSYYNNYHPYDTHSHMPPCPPSHGHGCGYEYGHGHGHEHGHEHGHGCRGGSCRSGAGNALLLLAAAALLAGRNRGGH